MLAHELVHVGQQGNRTLIQREIGKGEKSLTFMVIVTQRGEEKAFKRGFSR
ncbi:MAG: hypothetical protein IPJ40_18265 [Saprospirales bacterium]|nr:hypothetical protein [Saprospirales bacterium]